MGRAPCCSKVGLMRGPWSAKEDALLTEYINKHGEGQWRSLPKKAGLLRCGKSCRLRWMNYLRPGIVRGNITDDEDDLIVRLHGLLGNRWSLIAGRLPGRTDNEIKNYWNTCLLKKLQTAGEKPLEYSPEPAKKRPGKDPKKNGNKDDKATNRVKVYLPKPVRLCSSSLPRRGSFDSLASGSSNAGAGVEVQPAAVGGVAGWCDGGGGDDFMRSLLGGCGGSVSSEEMDTVYDEYLQLLQSM